MLRWSSRVTHAARQEVFSWFGNRSARYIYYRPQTLVEQQSFEKIFTQARESIVSHAALGIFIRPLDHSWDEEEINDLAHQQ